MEHQNIELAAIRSFQLADVDPDNLRDGYKVVHVNPVTLKHYSACGVTGWRQHYMLGAWVRPENRTGLFAFSTYEGAAKFVVSQQSKDLEIYEAKLMGPFVNNPIIPYPNKRTVSRYWKSISSLNTQDPFSRLLVYPPPDTVLCKQIKLRRRVPALVHLERPAGY